MKRTLLLLALALAGCASSTPAPEAVAPGPARLAAAPDRFFTTDGVRLRSGSSAAFAVRPPPG